MDPTGLKHSINPFDELSIEEAIRLREKGVAVSEIVAFSAGPPKTTDCLRTALALGVDRVIHVEVAEPEADLLEPLTVAKLISAVAKEEKSDLVILGKQAIDDDAGQTGPMVAGLLGWPQATQAAKLDISQEGKSATVVREVDGGVETVKMNVPLVVTTDLRLNVPRYAVLQNIMKAKRKPITKKTMADYGLPSSLADQVRVKPVAIAEPAGRSGGVKVENVSELVSKLKELGAI